MEFKIKDETETEPSIELWLEVGGDNINLKGKDKNGSEKNIMSFRDGIFYKHANATLKGLETDERGRIKEEEVK